MTHRTRTRTPRVVLNQAHALEALEQRQLLAFDPTASEQYMLELLNRFRAAPRDELALMTTSLGTPARSADGPTDGALQFFNVSGPTLAQQFAVLNAVPALAWNEALYNAAEGHNGQMIAFDEQSHQLPGEPDLGQRATNAGYTNWATVGENVYAFARSVFHGHTGFVIDWGNSPTGIQQPPGHRDSMLSAAFREVGIRIQGESNSSTSVGPLVISQEFGRRQNQGNAFVLGVVYADGDNDDFYSPGEGFGNVTITLANELITGAPVITTTSMSAGGWQVQAPPGQYTVTFSGSGLGQSIVYRNVVVSSQNVKIDGVRGVVPPEPNIQIWGAGRQLTADDFQPNLYDNTNFGQANLGQQVVTRDFSIVNRGTRELQLTNINRIEITGAHPADFIFNSFVPGTIGVGQTANFSIRFDPRGAGLRTATVTIISNDPDTPVFSFGISGRGSAKPVAGVTGKNDYPISNNDTVATARKGTTFGPTTAVFGETIREFAVVNNGLSNLRLVGDEPVTIANDATSSYEVIEQPTGVIAPGGSAVFRVRVVPQVAGVIRASVVVRTSDPSTPTYSFWVQATGVAVPRMQVSGASIPIARNDDTPTIADRTDFGRRRANVNERIRLFTITNLGVGTLRLTAPRLLFIGGTNAADFRIIERPRTSILGAHESITFTVAFRPQSTGTRIASVVIPTNDALGEYRFDIAGLAI